MAWLVSALIAFGALSTIARAAGTATFDLAPRETYVGSPITLRVEVRNASQHDAPETPDVPGATVDAQSPQRSSFTSIVNGRRTDLVTVVYVYRITPRGPGELVVPSVAVTVDKRRFASEPTTVVVKPAQSDDRFIVEVASTLNDPWVGQSINLTLQLWIKPYVDQRMSIRVPPETMWELIDEASEWGVFEPEVRALRQRRQAPATVRRDRPGDDGKNIEYYVLEIPKRVFPARPGPIDVGDIAIRMRYPRRLEERRSLFGNDLVIADSTPVIATLRPPSIAVRALPEAGRPAAFRGAVGQFELSASATPRDAAVGEPIDLSLTVLDRTIGGADLESLAPPPVATQPDVVADFRVATDLLAGEVQGWTKTFTQTIRARRDDVTRIPPIAFAYFDPKVGAYRIARSAPIGVEISPATGIDPTSIVDARGVGASGEPEPDQTAETGLVANELDAARLLRPQALALGPVAVGTAVLPPLAFIALLAWRVVRRRDERDPAGARRRRARRLTRHRLSSLRATDGVAAIRTALADCIADCANLPPGGLTVEETVRAAQSIDLDAGRCAELRRIMTCCDAAEYARDATSSAAMPSAATPEAATVETFEALRCAAIDWTSNLPPTLFAGRRRSSAPKLPEAVVA